ncbi:MAG: Resolvase helix-turn-helix protein [Parcubacteria group bacterium Gr01-1014_2]|nr:MAG: Resolvase helix-turn-helix protein [Parcubacteria group bacterium Gr01-1014_2]
MNPRKDYQTALALRLEGKTYGEIRNTFGIPKSTLSVWFSKLKVSKKAQRIIESKRGNGYLKLIEFNKIRTLNIKEENERIRKDYESKINNLSNRELMILGAALYWGEGYKNFNIKRNGTYPYICFGNSDPQMIAAFIEFLKRILGISKEKIKGQVMIYPNLNPKKSVDYWQSITKIPKENFRYQVALSRASQRKRPKHLLPYGTLQLRVSRRQEFFKIKGLIDGIIKSLD